METFRSKTRPGQSTGISASLRRAVVTPARTELSFFCEIQLKKGSGNIDMHKDSYGKFSMKTRSGIFRLLHISLALVIATTLLSSCYGENEVSPKDSKFNIAILDKTIFSNPPGLGYSIDTSWPILESAFQTKVIFQLEISDIESCDWSKQEITLSESGNEKIINNIHSCEVQTLDLCLASTPFIVVFNRKPVYGGLIQQKIPIATAYNFPVIFTDLVNDKVIFSIRPNNSLQVQYNDEDWNLIKDPEILNYFELQDKVIK